TSAPGDHRWRLLPRGSSSLVRLHTQVDPYGKRWSSIITSAPGDHRWRLLPRGSSSLVRLHTQVDPYGKR
ncbi:hypothetical protein CKJ89_39255, partial [Klebsiella pneumoniae]